MRKTLVLNIPSVEYVPQPVYGQDDSCCGACAMTSGVNDTLRIQFAKGESVEESLAANGEMGTIRWLNVENVPLSMLLAAANTNLAPVADAPGDESLDKTQKIHWIDTSHVEPAQAWSTMAAPAVIQLPAPVLPAVTAELITQPSNPIQR